MGNLHILRLAVATAALALVPVSGAAWDLRQGNGTAVTKQEAGRYTVMLNCSRGRGAEISVLDTTLRGDAFAGVQSLMVWIELPDGRTDRVPIIPVWQEGAALSGEFVPNGWTMDFFRNGVRLKVDSPGTRQTFVSTDMSGTGAARLAFLEQCGI